MNYIPPLSAEERQRVQQSVLKYVQELKIDLKIARVHGEDLHDPSIVAQTENDTTQLTQLAASLDSLSDEELLKTLQHILEHIPLPDGAV